MTHLVPLPWARPPLSLNDRDHWRPKAAKVARARNEARWAIRAARIPAFETVHLTLHWRVPDRRRRDLDNLAATLKPVTDALVDEGRIPDDDWQHVLAATTQIHAPDPRAPAGALARAARLDVRLGRSRSMTVCGNRTDTPGFFTSCASVHDGRCLCGEEVITETVESAG